MDVCKRRLAAEGFSTLGPTLGTVYRPDPVVPEAMLAILRALDMPAPFLPVTSSNRETLRP